MAKAFAKSLDCGFSRVQFTPDLLPSELTGINFFNQKKAEFEFNPAASSQTSCWATRSTAPPPAPSPPS